MNKSKNLPRLSELYLQRKKYDAHLKRIIEIKSGSKGHHVSSNQSPGQHQLEKQKTSKNTGLRYESKINKTNECNWIKPFEKFKRYEADRQNSRLKGKIISSVSRLDCWRKDKEVNELTSLKKRIRKYDDSKQLGKMILKTQKSLQKINPKKTLVADVLNMYKERNKLKRSLSPQQLNKSEKINFHSKKAGQFDTKQIERLRKNLMKTLNKNQKSCSQFKEYKVEKKEVVQRKSSQILQKVQKQIQE